MRSASYFSVNFFYCIKNLLHTRFVAIFLFFVIAITNNVNAQDGMSDPQFGSYMGWQITSVSFGALSDMAIPLPNQMVKQSDGKLLVSVNNYDNTGIEIFRYNTNGSLDNSFGTNGHYFKSISLYYSTTLALQQDGKILIGGVSEFNSIITRLNSNGTMDASFGNAGSFSMTSFNIASIIVLADNKVLIGGTGIDFALIPAYVGNGNSDGGKLFKNSFTIFKYNANWTIDNSFGTNGGKAIFFDTPSSYTDLQTFSSNTNVYSYNPYVTSMVVNNDGSIIIGGTYSKNTITIGPNGTTNYTSSSDQFAMAKFSSNGVLDNSFGTNGKITTNINNKTFSQLYALGIQSDGKIIGVGSSTNANSYTQNSYGYYYIAPAMQAIPLSDSTQMTVVRFTSTGSIDNSFGQNGASLFNLGKDMWSAHNVKIQADDKIVIAGGTDTKVTSSGNITSPNSMSKSFLTRLTKDGSLDASFAPLSNNILIFTTYAPAFGLIAPIEGNIYTSNLSGVNQLVVRKFISASTPGVAAVPIFSLQGNIAAMGGEVTSQGASAISERGVVYSKNTDNPNPLIGGTLVTKLVDNNPN